MEDCIPASMKPQRGSRRCPNGQKTNRLEDHILAEIDLRYNWTQKETLALHIKILKENMTLLEAVMERYTC
jgi:hypothetical protein